MPTQAQSVQQVQKQMLRQLTQLQQERMYMPDSLKRPTRLVRRKKGGWERKGIWEFPVKGPKELLKVL